MEAFTQIDGALAICKYPKGVQKQVQLYKRRDRVYVPHSGGFIEVRHEDIGGATVVTAHPDVKVLEMDEVPGLDIVQHGGLKLVRWDSRK